MSATPAGSKNKTKRGVEGDTPTAGQPDKKRRRRKTVWTCQEIHIRIQADVDYQQESAKEAPLRGEPSSSEQKSDLALAVGCESYATFLF